MWACHAPGEALATALDRQELAYEVAWGIGEFRPEWLEENWDQLPENLRLNASSGTRFWSKPEDPEFSFRMILKSGSNYSQLDQKNMLALAQKDPVKAYELIKSIPGGSSINSTRNRHVASLFAILGREDPALLAQIAPFAKSPIERTQIQAARFKGLLLENPQAAKAMLDRLPDSWIKEDLAFDYASHLLAKDPRKGFPQALDTLKKQLNQPTRYTVISHESGGGRSGVRGPNTDELLHSLVEHNAPALMDGLITNADSYGESGILPKAGREWATRDLPAYADWLEDHRNDQKTYEDGITNIVGSLRDYGHYQEGLKWIEKLPVTPEIKATQAASLYQTWLRGDPQSALAWRQSPEFTGDPKLFPIPANPNEQLNFPTSFSSRSYSLVEDWQDGF